MSVTDIKEPTYCVNCKYHQPNASSGCLGEYDKCAAVIKTPNRISPVTGKVLPCEYEYCVHLNRDAKCERFESKPTESCAYNSEADAS